MAKEMTTQQKILQWHTKMNKNQQFLTLAGFEAQTSTQYLSTEYL
jgi:hypothetical protein